MKDIFFQEYGKQILLSLNKKDRQYVSELATNIKGTYAHIFNLLKEMEKSKIISSKKGGRTRYIALTPKGKKMAALLREFNYLLSVGTKVKEIKVGETERTKTNKKLRIYLDSLTTLLDKIAFKKLKREEVANYARLFGKYRSLISKLRPRDAAGKKIKAEAISKLEYARGILNAY